jgi:hypothetical protein
MGFNGKAMPPLPASFAGLRRKGFTMRPNANLFRLPVLVIAASLASVTPAFAQNTPAIEFVSGTGENFAVAEAAPADAGILQGRAALADAPRKDARDAEAEMIAMGDKMSDPDMQDGVAQMAEKMGETMMRLPIGKFVSAIEKARPGTVKKSMREDATLADLAGRDAENIPETLGKQSRVAMSMMGGFAKAFASMMPEFEKMGKEMAASMDDIKSKRR